MKSICSFIICSLLLLALFSCVSDKIEYCDTDSDIRLEREALQANNIRYSSITKVDSVYGKYFYSETIFEENGLATKNAFYFENGDIFLLDFYKYDSESRVIKVTKIDSFEHRRTIKTYDYSGKQEYQVDSLFSKGFLIEWTKYMYKDGKYMTLTFDTDGLKYTDLHYRSPNCRIDSIVRFNKSGQPTGEKRVYTYMNDNKITDLLIKDKDTLEYHFYNHNDQGRMIGIEDFFWYDGETFSNQMSNTFKNGLISSMTFISTTEYSDGKKEIDTIVNNINYSTSIPKDSKLNHIPTPTNFNQ